MDLFEAVPLVHGADERIAVRDLGFAARFYADAGRDGLLRLMPPPQRPTGDQ